MVEASFYNYYFLDKHRRYLENINLYSLLETNFSFKRVSKYDKSECLKLIDNISNGISNCLNYIFKTKNCFRDIYFSKYNNYKNPKTNRKLLYSKYQFKNINY